MPRHFNNGGWFALLLNDLTVIVRVQYVLPRLALIELMFGISSVTARPDTLLPDGDQTESSAFKSWFGESKIVDEHGKPLVVYHGTRQWSSRKMLTELQSTR